MEIQMRKGIVALAVMSAFSGAALAQSSVTLYGILDIGYQWNEVPTNVGTTAAPRISQESYSAINGGHQSGNRWGLRGSESLGGGWNAIFTLESGFDLDRGTSGQGGRLFGRQAWVGVQSGLGTVVAGRLATFSSGTGSFDMFGRTDPFLTGFGLASLGNTFISANALRIDNTIAYQSPKFAGFQAGLGYSTRVDGAEVAPNDANTSAFITGLNFELGPFFAVVTYDQFNGAEPLPDQKHLQIGGTFDLGPLRFHAAYADQSNIGAVSFQTGLGSGTFAPLPAGISNYDANAYMLGLTWKVGAFAVMGSWQSSDADGQTRVVAGQRINFEPDYDIYSIGGTYNLSRRTNLYASYAWRDASGTLANDNFDAAQFALGIRHLF
jgi:predicted porin